MSPQEIHHLYWRVAFGISPNEMLSLSHKTRRQIVNNLFNKASQITPLNVDSSEIDHFNLKSFSADASNKRKFVKKSRALIIDFNANWINRLINSDALLRERMTLFWANHFVCKDSNVYHVVQFNNTLRNHALGHFGDFVKAISKQAAMLKYLNNKQNRNHKPNENFARELMELFTLGEGHYSEKDIKESARAFTGYNHNFEGEFVLRLAQHDQGHKSFFGQRGRYDGDDIIDIILRNKQCARYISEKIYRYFVNPVLNMEHVNAMTYVFYKDYNIENLMRFVFMSDWFYEEKNIGVKIKSPIELLVGLAKTVPTVFEDHKDLIKIQRLLGQTLLDPPNVGGWKGDKAWIDANTIMMRLKLPSLLLNNALISLKRKGDFNDNFREHFFKRNKNKLPFKTLPDWTSFNSKFQSIETKKLSDYLLQGQVNRGTKSYLLELSKESKRDFCIQLMSLPEYQMC